MAVLVIDGNIVAEGDSDCVGVGVDGLDSSLGGSSPWPYDDVV